MSDKIVDLPVKFKDPHKNDHLVLVRGHKSCRHDQFVVDGEKAEVECGKCKEKLNPMWVLQQLCNKESHYHDCHKRYHEEMKRLSERSKTKCQYCHQMTRISR